MEIAVYVTQAALLVAVGLMGGMLFAERGQRRRAQQAVADAIEALEQGRIKAQDEMREIVTSINKAHNTQAQALADLAVRVEAVSNRINVTAAAGRLGPTHGSIPRPPTVKG